MEAWMVPNSHEVITARREAIRQAMLRDSARIKQPNFESIDTGDLSRLVDLYDLHFFGGWLGRAVKAKASAPLGLRLSTTMTRAGGKTVQHRVRCENGDSENGDWLAPPFGACLSPFSRRARSGASQSPFSQPSAVWFEIAIASRMLFMNFRHDQPQRPVSVGGLECTDRLDALQRIMEHEIVHLAEMLAWGKSRCTGERFKQLAAGLFGHCDVSHALVTARENAAVRHGIKVGSLVTFDFRGREIQGRVNRIHQRATVLVDDPAGPLYSDGGKYAKFYVPLAGLRPA